MSIKSSNRNLLWLPNKDKDTKLDSFRKFISIKYGINIDTYSEFHEWSCRKYDLFWEEVWNFCDIIHSQPYDQVVDRTKGIADIPQWFSGSQLNYAENLLRHDDDRIALYAAGEGRNQLTTRTYRELRVSVAKYASAMRNIGIKKGDRVVGYMPNCCETVEVMLAATSLGAIWSSASPDFGPTGVLERFSQIQPKLLFSVNAVRYNSKIHRHLVKLQDVAKGLGDLVKVVILPFVEESTMELCPPIKNSCTFEEFLAFSDTDPQLHFEQLPFSHPLFIMYSSGTTGVPKCMVHSAGGTLVKHLEEHVIQSGMTRDDIMLFYTTAGWMMWNWMVSCLAVGCGLVLYDGSPLIPHASVLWDLIDEIGITILGTGAKCLSVFRDQAVKPAETHSLHSLRMIMSTGSPLKPALFDYLYEDVKKDMMVASIAGGTDIIACFMGQNETTPVYRGEIQSVQLGCSVETWTEDGQRVLDESGELVVLLPFPSMPIYFWNDPDNVKYRQAYFSKFPGVWAHGDFCQINSETGGVIMLGRSDGTLNPNGVRFGTADIYNIVESYKEINDSLCVAQKSRDGMEERVILFLKMAPHCEFSQELVCDLRTAIRLGLSARHVPAIIMPIDDIPYTLSGKKVESAVKQILIGQKVLQIGALANPESLDLFITAASLMQDF